MRFRLAAVSALMFAVSAPAIAAEMPARKPGLWEMTMAIEGHSNLPVRSMQQCIDAATDKLMSSNFGGIAQEACSKKDISNSGGVITIDSVCNFGGATSTSHAVVSGDFNSAYTVDMTSTRSGGPSIPGVPAGGTTHMTISSKWLGPCAADQRPGDVIMGGGMKINILDMQKMKLPQRP